jgi:DNA-directed RNA polymerase subunit F
MIVERTQEYRTPNLKVRVREAQDHVHRYGRLDGETRRAAIVSLAALNTNVKRIKADVMGLLPADPV